MMVDKKKILFVCRHNLFRSRIAEEYMKKNSNYDLSSAGIISGKGYQPDSQKKSAMKFGLDISEKPSNLSISRLREQDLVIVVAKDIPKQVFDNPIYGLDGKLIFWEIEDVKDPNIPSEKNNEEIIKQIIKKVDTLIKELKVKKW